MDATSPHISIKDAASAAGLRLGFVRAFLASGDFAMMAAPPAKGRPVKASLVDVWRLRCFRILRDAGLSHAHAVYVLDLDVSPRVGALFAPGIAIPVSFLASRLADAAIHVVPDEGDEYPDVYATPSGHPVASDVETATTLNFAPILACVVDALTSAGGRTYPVPTFSPRGAPVSAGNPSSTDTPADARPELS